MRNPPGPHGMANFSWEKYPGVNWDPRSRPERGKAPLIRAPQTRASSADRQNQTGQRGAAAQDPDR